MTQISFTCGVSTAKGANFSSHATLAGPPLEPGIDEVWDCEGVEDVNDCTYLSSSLHHLVDALRAERVAIVSEMERRHEALVKSLAAFLEHDQQRDAAPPDIQQEKVDYTETCIEILDDQPVTTYTSHRSTAPGQAGCLRTTMTENEKMAFESKHAKGFWYICLSVRNIVFGVPFELIFAFLITTNCLAIAIEAQYRSFDTAHELTAQGIWPNANAKATDVWPRAETILFAIEFFFGVVFAFEVACKILTDPNRFFRSLWNGFDTLLVVFWFLNWVENRLGLNPFILRLLRISKLLRLVRLVKTMQIFDVLHILVGSLKASWTVFLWSTLLLLAIMVFASLVLNFALEEFIKNQNNPPQARKHVFERFGSFSRALLTMFEITLGNFYPPIELLRAEVGEWYVFMALAYLCIVNLSVVQVIRGVFLRETLKVAALDDEMMIMEQERKVRKHIADMDRFFKEADESGDGYLSYDEFIAILNDPRIKTWLAAREFDTSNAKIVFDLLDDGDNKLTAEEVVLGVAKLKGPARSIDVMSLHRMCAIIEHRCTEIEGRLASFFEEGSPYEARKDPDSPLSNQQRLKKDPGASSPTRRKSVRSPVRASRVGITKS